MLSNDANPDSKKFTLSGNDNLKIQLDWIAGIKKQIDFLNKKEVLPDFQIYFKVEHRTQESCLVCSCGHHYNCHALDEAWEDGGCRIWNCGCKEFDS